MIDWQRIWNDDSDRRFSPLRAILWVFSLLYRLIVFVRNRLYDRQIFKSVRLSRPVISIGNISAGGTGKTPCVILVAKILQKQGFRPAVISRGYGGASKKPVNIVCDGKAILLDSKTAGDEPLLIARSLQNVPVITGPKRDLTGQAAIDRLGADVILCDDAFQHRRLHRNIDIVLLDGRRPLGNGHMLPRGELRESPEGLKRAGCFILTRMAEPQTPDERIGTIARQSGIPVFSAAHRFIEVIQPAVGTRIQPGDIRHKKICAFCGIAKPDSFEKLLVESGMEILAFNPFPDHYAFSKTDLEALMDQFNHLQADYLVTTEKDAMRLVDYPDFYGRIVVARMAMEIHDAEVFEKFILEHIRGTL